MKRKTYYGRDAYNKYPQKRLKTATGYRAYRARPSVARTRGPMIASESKYTDSGIDATAISEGTTWVGSELDPLAPANTLFAPPQGAGIDERIGRRVALYKLAIRGVISTTALQDQADIVSSPGVRIVVYVDKQTNGIQSQGEEVMALGSPASAFALTATQETAFNSFQNINNFGRFHVLKDKTYTPRIVTSGTDGASTTSQCVSQICFKMVIKFRKPLMIKFDGSTGSYGSVADIVDNSIHLIAVKSSTAFAHTLQYISRGYYKDV